MSRLAWFMRLLMADPAQATRVVLARFCTAGSAIGARVVARLLMRFGRQAVWLALQNNKDWTPQPNVAIAGEIQRRIRRIEDLQGGNRYLPHRWRMIFNDLRRQTDGKTDWSAGPVCLNFGAGERNPVGLNLLFGLAGASQSYALEPGLIREEVATITLQEILWDVVCGPENYGLDAASLSRLPGLLDRQALRTGEPIEEVLAHGTIHLLRDGGENLPLPPQSLDLVYSRSVLEHVLPIEAAMAQLVKALKIGGVMYHDIGLDSHHTADPIAFYYQARGIADDRLADLNCWRKSDFVRLFESLGCSVDIRSEEKVAPERIDRNRLIERFLRYDDDDLRTVNAKMLVTRLH